MPSGGDDSRRRPDEHVEDSLAVRLLKGVASVALTIMIVALVALLFAPKDPGTLTLYGLVIGLNLLIFVAFWPAVRWLRRLGR